MYYKFLTKGEKCSTIKTSVEQLVQKSIFVLQGSQGISVNIICKIDKINQFAKITI